MAKDRYLVVRWADDSWDDLIPWSDLAKEGRFEPYVHSMGPLRARTSAQAFCELIVRRTEATFDYERFEKLNKQRGCEIGRMRITFDDSKRESVSSIDWKARGKKKWWTEAASASDHVFGHQKKYVKESRRPRTRRAEVLARDGQADFRAQMFGIYGGRCAISECVIEAALEGAHIDTYAEGDSHSPQNGLLLRSDLHALFDVDLLGIDPRSRLIHIGAAARFAPYDRLHQSARLRLPMGGNSYAPSADALARRWREFRKRNGRE
jgi:hypothetical protein